MGAYIVVHATVLDPDKMQEYAAVAGPMRCTYHPMAALGDGLNRGKAMVWTPPPLIGM